MRRLAPHVRRRLTFAVVLVVLAGPAAVPRAATSEGGTIETPTDDSLGTKQTLTFTAGPFAAASLAGTETSETVAICTQAVTPPALCAVYPVSINLPAGYWATRRGTLAATIRWVETLTAQNDLDLYIVDEEGNPVASSTNGFESQEETATLINPGTGARTYRVVVVNWATTQPIESVSGTVTFNLIAQPGALPPGPTPPAFAPRFFSYKPPSGLGEHAGEPTLGVNFATGSVMYIALLETLKATFRDTASPAIVDWFNKSFVTTSNRTNDPILFTDSLTGRTFVSQLLFPSKHSLSAYTSTDGDTWEISQGAGINSGVDHQTIGGGRFPDGLGSIDPTYPHAVYYAAQDLALAEFAASLDGGRTYGPAVPMYTLVDCDGIHGHIKVSPSNGYVYVPLRSCGEPEPGDGQVAAAISTDAGITWNLSRVPNAKASTWDPSVAISKNGVVYFAFGDNGDREPKVAVSRNSGQSWTVGPDLGAEWGIKRIAFPAIVAGDDDRAAFAFLGTRYDGEQLGSAAGFEGTWELYVATTYNGGDSWVVVNATGDDPVQRGNICDAGFSCPAAPDTRNLLDFMDVQIDAQGRILVAYADGCVSPQCIAGVDRNNDGFVNGLDNDAADKAAIARQGGGLGLLSAYDTPVPSRPAPPQLVAGLEGQAAYLAWSTPDDGGSPITGYQVYRNNVAIANVGADVNSYVDSTTTPQTAYRVTAINALGPGSSSSVAFPTILDTACRLPGLLVADDRVDFLPNQPQHTGADVQTVYVSEPYGDATGRLHFTVKTGGGLPPNSQWYLIWQRTTPDATHDRNYVAMRSDLLGTVSFEHGRVSYPLVPTSPATNQGNLPMRVGAATGTYDAPTGVMRISVPTSSVDNVQPGDALLGIEVRTFLGRNDLLPINQNIASDFSPAGSYTMVGNASCADPPAAPTGLTASSRKGVVALNWADNATNETGFVIERSTSPGSEFAEIAHVPANTVSFSDTTATRKITYYYRLRAANGLARSAYSNVASVRVK